MTGIVFLCKVTEEAKVEIELQKERRVEGFQRQVILLELQIFVWLHYLSSWRKKCVNLEKCRQLQQLAELEIKHARYVGHSSVMGEMRIRFSCVTRFCNIFFCDVFLCYIFLCNIFFRDVFFCFQGTLSSAQGGTDIFESRGIEFRGEALSSFVADWGLFV